MSILLIIDHHVCHIIGGHGDLNGKLNDLGLTDDPKSDCSCPYESADHLLFDCNLFNDERRKMVMKIEVI